MKLVFGKVNVDLAFHLALSFIAFLIAVFPKLVVLGFICLFLTIFIGLKNKEIKFKLNSVFILFISLYLCYVFGCFFTHHISTASKYLEYKLTFILVPILFSFRPDFRVKLAFPIVGSALGVFLASIFGIFKAFSVYYTSNCLFASFTSSNICIDHPSYFSAIATFSVASVWYLRREKTLGFNGGLSYLFLSFTLIMIFLSYAMAAILFLLLCFSFFMLRWVYLKRIKWMSISFFLFFPFLLIFLLSIVPAFKDEVNNSKVALSNYLVNPTKFIQGNNKSLSGDQVRLVMWTVSIKTWAQHPFGVGTGNVDEYLSKELIHVGQFELAKLDQNFEIKYNPHNQFLQIGIELGIIGIIVFLWSLFQTIKIGFRSQNWLLIFLVFCLIFNCLFESMLQRQTGIVFFIFWICLLVVYSTSTNPYLDKRNIN